MDKWDRRFLALAEHIAQWSKDPSTKVGAVVADTFNRIVSVGYNGFPRGVLDSEERLANRELKYQLVLHAEVNALLLANKSAAGCILYTVPGSPCVNCAIHAIQLGIKRVVAPDYLHPRFGDSQLLGRKMLEEAGVQVTLVEA